jgi:hypothetical protein
VANHQRRCCSVMFMRFSSIESWWALPASAGCTARLASRPPVYLEACWNWATAGRAVQKPLGKFHDALRCYLIGGRTHWWTSQEWRPAFPGWSLGTRRSTGTVAGPYAGMTKIPLYPPLRKGDRRGRLAPVAPTIAWMQVRAVHQRWRRCQPFRSFWKRGAGTCHPGLYLAHTRGRFLESWLPQEWRKSPSIPPSAGLSAALVAPPAI